MKIFLFAAFAAASLTPQSQTPEASDTVMFHGADFPSSFANFMLQCTQDFTKYPYDPAFSLMRARYLDMDFNSLAGRAMRMFLEKPIDAALPILFFGCRNASPTDHYIYSSILRTGLEWFLRMGYSFSFSTLYVQENYQSS